MRRLFAYGGIAASIILLAFGIGALVIGLQGRSEVRDTLDREYIVGGRDMSPDEIKKGAQESKLPASIALPSCTVVDERINTGDEARCFASYMRIHALESTGGLTYAQMGRFQSASNPDDAKGTNDEAAAAKDDAGQPIPNGVRNVWVTETALSTALNTSFFAERVAVFSIVMGIALLLTGIGFLVLTLGGALGLVPLPGGKPTASAAVH
jgi:hypothetical protein